MNDRLSSLAAAAMLAAAPLCVRAAEPDVPQLMLAQAGVPLGAGEGDTLMFAAGELGGERVVKGAPYCAEAQQEAVQTLADGNRIVRRQTTRHCRDGEGRTRQETERNGRPVVYLRDPAAHESWLLDLERKTARRLGSVGAGAQSGFDGAVWREYAERMREWGRAFRDRAGDSPVPPIPAPPPTAPAPALIQPERAARNDAGSRQENKVVVVRVDGGQSTLPPLPGLPPMAATLPDGVALRAQLGAPRGRGVVTALGSKEIEGLKVNGERTTWTIEAGKLGNERAIVITHDVWTSPELLVTVRTRDWDPRSGESTYRLVNLRRGDPDPASMRVPPDFSRSGSAAPPPQR